MGVVNLVVVGDCLLDVDLIGTVTRLCPDAPAPVLAQRSQRSRAGGAGLAARLAATDGVDVTLVTVIAPDADGAVLRECLDGLRTVAGRAERSTSVKTRLIADGRPIARVDRGGDGPAPLADDRMLAALHEADAILVSDYGCGLSADPRLRAVLTERAARVPVVWDPHPRGAEPVPGVAAVVPNLAEAKGFAGVDETGLAGASRSAAWLREAWQVDAVVVTMGARGALLVTSSGEQLVPAPEVRAVDVCGAGDRFASVVATELMRGKGLPHAVADAVRKSAAFVAADIAEEMSRQSIVDEKATAQELVAAVRERGGTVVATGGCFDLLHAGHARTLRAARALGDCLVVCLNSDESVRRLKGAGRPITGQRERAELLAALDCVDAVVVFDEDGPQQVLSQLRPDIWVKGGDYTPDRLPETPLVRSWGGTVVVTPYLEGRSSTRIAETLTSIVEEGDCVPTGR
ncbi:D-glycero-beta-D-manno-heptose 1-phosphate adenylyltransferase [Labedaea rhizosphaerae]|uniref:D-glycero-beta-D-manno-heptose 1-phosphate adenylyltransferase n=1 Tax=Labedaea rhizosphaerae TaxID=598644 RepID=A0A4R6SAB9_LABRH|nr:D-glycero-beta-D-manno-heptose 1-phosphate adenylyltransferase [Labedaea rhizosphaerae]TDP96464.1 rfaE bifunctional protein kinase chain/domain/rfaE bifunctional protein nucleotidyltransferase chain/domain [Labedaea rhizosphaerae]